MTKVTYTDDRKVVSRITLKDGNGDFAEILIEDGIVSGADGKNNLASQVKKGRTVRAIGILHLDSDGRPVLRVRNCDEVVYVPPVPVSLGSRQKSPYRRFDLDRRRGDGAVRNRAGSAAEEEKKVKNYAGGGQPPAFLH